MKYADLHVHTFYSDSTFSPEEVISRAKDKALSAIAICDHDTVDGIPHCLRIAPSFGVEVIPSIELSVEKPDAEVHMLGYFIDWTEGWFKEKLGRMQDFRVGRLHRMIEKLNKMGIGIKSEDVFKFVGKGSAGRLHLAKALISTGKVKGIREAFDRYIGFLKPCYEPNMRFLPQEAIEDILKLGGVPVLAHPAAMGHDEYIPELVGYGLKGIEVYHTDHNRQAVSRYEEIAENYGLIKTGGSDCHGLGKAKVLIGTVRVPYDVVENLKKACGKA